ncbi:sulfurtransferase TusA family protein [Palleronia sp. LCG004]|uniref:sulfurtransferase TusA family protein n=1 Tax=Palleronia sp. LCG004 TaxID=3079304 RepID=UPI002942AEB8|nr:sulfurtransferase TusA family protein [Palleronia sp. LCG004]WOI55096.1 sulfurtransferase TusA family protein [Palleronia sp. LCG004]
MDFDDDVDARGLLCPLPVLKLRKRLSGLGQGTILRLLADDPAAAVDVPHFCAEAGHELLGQSETDDVQIYYVRKR